MSFLYFVGYFSNKLWVNFQVGSLTCFLIFYHKCDWLRYIGNTIEFNINHLFYHQIVIPFFCNFPQLLALICGWKLCWKKYMSLTKIFHCRILKQFVNLITLLCDGKCHCNAAKTVLRQLIVAYVLNGILECVEHCLKIHIYILSYFSLLVFIGS